jgi:hypothetical protein
MSECAHLVVLRVLPLSGSGSCHQSRWGRGQPKRRMGRRWLRYGHLLFASPRSSTHCRPRRSLRAAALRQRRRESGSRAQRHRRGCGPPAHTHPRGGGIAALCGEAVLLGLAAWSVVPRAARVLGACAARSLEGPGPLDDPLPAARHTPCAPAMSAEMRSRPPRRAHGATVG